MEILLLIVFILIVKVNMDAKKRAKYPDLTHKSPKTPVSGRSSL